MNLINPKTITTLALVASLSACKNDEHAFNPGTPSGGEGSSASASSSSGGGGGAIEPSASEVFAKSLEGTNWVSTCISMTSKSGEVHFARDIYEFKTEGKVKVNRLVSENRAKCESGDPSKTGHAFGTFSGTSARTLNGREEEPGFLGINAYKIALDLPTNRADFIEPRMDIELGVRSDNLDDDALFLINESARTDEHGAVYVNDFAKVYKKQ